VKRRIVGVYAILGPNGVYVGQSLDCLNRGSLQLAIKLGLQCGIVREVRRAYPERAMRARLLRNESAVARLFARRGLSVVSRHQQEAA
jgi:hypothetical protein